MALSFKARKRWSIVALVVALPLYIVVTVNVVELFDRPPFLVELLIYVVLGIVWTFPLKKLFLGVGKPDPDAPPET